jgi:flagellar biosynthesis/type III secretory pathway protein FliH
MDTSLQVRVAGAPVSLRVVDAAEVRARDEAEARGRAAGFAEGQALALSGAVRRLEAAAEELRLARELTADAVAVDATRLALAIAREIVRSEIDAGRYDIERIVREALAASGAGRTACVVHLNPIDVERLAGVPFRAATRLESDPEIAAGDVHVSTARGTLVRDVDAAMATLAERFEEDVR